jgi:hypothetical protein
MRHSAIEAGLDGLGALDLLAGGEQPVLADAVEVGADRVAGVLGRALRRTLSRTLTDAVDGSHRIRLSLRTLGAWDDPHLTRRAPGVGISACSDFRSF